MIAGLPPFSHALPFTPWNKKNNNVKHEQAQQKQRRVRERYMLRYLPNFTAQLSDSKYGALARHPDPEALRSRFREGLSKYKGIDEKIFNSEEYISTMSDVVRDVFRQGWKGYAEDGKILNRKWDFELEDIECDNLLFVYGGRDNDTPPKLGRGMSKLIPGSRFAEYADETHASLLRVKGTEIIGDLLRYG